MLFDFLRNERSRSLTPGDKNYLIRVARGKCEYCGGDIIGEGIVPEVHHIVPFASGGSDREHNLIVLCPNCHTRVDHISRAELRLKIEYRLPRKISESAAGASKETAKKATPKNAVAKKATPKKTGVKKTAPKKAVAKKAAPKKAAAKMAAPKKAVAKEIASKKAVAKKTAPKKAVAKKVAPKKVVVKKAAPKKNTSRKVVTKKR